MKGLIVFDNSLQMENILAQLNTMEDSAFDDYEKNNFRGFISQKTLYGLIQKAEDELVEMYHKAETEDEKKSILKRGYSDLYKSKLESGFITQYIDKNGYSSFDYSINSSYYAPIANEKGFYAIGDTIYQLTSTQTKTWINGNINDLSVLEKAYISDSTKNIYVKDHIETRANSSHDSYWKEVGSYKFSVFYEFKPTKYTNTSWHQKIAVHFRCQHYGGMAPFKKWKDEPWDMNYYISRRASTHYTRTAYPYGNGVATNSTFRNPSSGLSTLRIKDTWISVSAFDADINTTNNDTKWLCSVPIGSQLQPINDVTLDELTIRAEFPTRINIILTKSSYYTETYP